MRRRHVASTLVLLFQLLADPTEADLLAQVPESTELVPGAVLARQGEVAVEMGVAQLLTFADARAGWARARLPLVTRWHVELLGARVRAGAWQEDRQGLRLIVVGRRVAAALGAAVVRARVEDLASLRHGRGWAEVAYQLGPARVGARWEGPWRESTGWPAGSMQLHVAVQGSTWSAGAWRPRASYADTPVWGVGFAARLHEQFRFGARLRAERAELLFWISPGPWRVGLIVPVVSLVGAGPTVAVGWAP